MSITTVDQNCFSEKLLKGVAQKVLRKSVAQKCRSVAQKKCRSEEREKGEGREQERASALGHQDEPTGKSKGKVKQPRQKRVSHGGGTFATATNPGMRASGVSEDGEDGSPVYQSCYEFHDFIAIGFSDEGNNGSPAYLIHYAYLQFHSNYSHGFLI